MQVPNGWTLTSDEYSIQLLANPNDDDAPIMGMVAAAISANLNLTPRQLSQQKSPAVQLRGIGQKNG